MNLSRSHRIIQTTTLALCLAILLCSGCKDAAKEEAGKTEQAAGPATVSGASSTEAKQNLRAIASGAEIYVQSEHVDPNNPLVATTNVFPPAPVQVCTAGGEGGTTDPSETAWRASPWNELGFSMTRPHVFAYCYETSQDNKRFAALAESETSAFCLKGQVKGGAPRIGNVMELGDDDECDP